MRDKDGEECRTAIVSGITQDEHAEVGICESTGCVILLRLSLMESGVMASIMVIMLHSLK